MRALEREDRLDRAVEDLPNDEILEEYRVAGDFKGLTRPELSVLLAYAKMTLFDDLVASDVPEDAYLATDLVRYFPQPLRKKFRTALHDHRLRREIIATFVANSMVNRVGITFVHDVMEETGMSVSDVARAYAVTRDAFDLRLIWSDIEALDNKVSAALQSEMVLTVRDLVQHSTEWFMRNLERPLDIAEAVNGFRPGIAVLEEKIEDLFGDLDAKAAKKKRDRLKKQGVPEALARRVALLGPMAAACDIVLSADQCGKPVEDVARVYFAVGGRLGLDWLRASAEQIAIEDHWERLAITAIVEDLFSQQRALTNAVINAADGASGEAAIAAWAESNKAAVERSNDLIGEFKTTGGIDIARLAIANRHIRTMIVGG
jgi:glutamate dehydrogenase